MQTRRIQLIDLRSSQPLDPSWSPTVEPEEIEEANSLLAECHLPYRWHFIPTTVTLSGAATLQSAASDDSIQLSAAGPGL